MFNKQCFNRKSTVNSKNINSRSNVSFCENNPFYAIIIKYQTHPPQSITPKTFKFTIHPPLHHHNKPSSSWKPNIFLRLIFISFIIIMTSFISVYLYTLTSFTQKTRESRYWGGKWWWLTSYFPSHGKFIQRTHNEWNKIK